MTVRRIRIDPPAGARIGRLDAGRVDATSDADIALQAAADERDAMQDATQFARRVRQRLGLSQAEFARRIDVSADTIRNWEQGKRSRLVLPGPCCGCWTRPLNWLCRRCGDWRFLAAAAAQCRTGVSFGWVRDVEAATLNSHAPPVLPATQTAHC